MKTEKMTIAMHFYLLVLFILSYLSNFILCIKTTGGNAGGKDCVMPYIYQNQKYYACTMANHYRPWCATTSNYDSNKLWGNCESPNIATFGGTARGDKCYFPYRFLGGDRYECITDYHDQPWCGTTRNYDNDKRWGNCGATALKTTEGNSYGAPCCFPFNYEGVDFVGCTQFDSRFRRPWCSTTPNYDADEQWGYCQIRSSRGNSNGADCKFPFLHNNREYGRCLISPELSRFEPWCSTTYNYDTDKKWGYCISRTTHSCEASEQRTTLPGVSTTVPTERVTTIPPGGSSTCTYTRRRDNTNAAGGRPSSGAQTVQECMRQCDESTQCVGFDWDTNANVPSRCWHHLDISNLANLNVGGAPGISHYRKLSCTGQPGSTCEFEKRDNTNAFGGAGVPGISNPDVCRTQCCLNEDCVAYEWDTNSGIQCFIHTDRDRDRVETLSRTSATVTQFRKTL